MRAPRSLLVLLLFLGLAGPGPAEGVARAGSLASAGRAAAAKRARKPAVRRQKPSAGKAQAELQFAELRQTMYISRDIASHDIFLGPSFFRSLRTLGKGDHWIEIGPSSDARMALGYLFDTPEAAPYGFPDGKARVTGIGLEPLHPQIAGQIDQAMRQRGVKYDHRAGRYLESYKRNEIDKANLVNDQFGAFAYTARPQKIIEIEGNLLAKGGMLHTHSSPFTKIVDRQGNDVTMQWIEAIEGLELVEHTEVNQHDMSWHQIALRRTDGPVRAPALRRTLFEAGHPPTREFVWDGRPARPAPASRKRARPAETVPSRWNTPGAPQPSAP